MSRLRTGILGFGKMPADCTRILLNQGVPVEFVLETEESRFSFLKAMCLKNNILYRKASKAEAAAFLGELNEPTVVFSANNNFIFHASIVGKSDLRIVNFHGSVLPSYPGHGQSIPTWIVYNNESRHGVTWHLVNEQIDAGNILYQEIFEVSDSDTAMSVMMRSIRSGVALFGNWWERLLDFDFHGIPQAENPQRIYQSTLQDRLHRKADVPNNGYLDPSWDFEHAFRFLRSMDYSPLQLIPPPRIELDGETYSINRYKVDPSGRKEKGDVGKCGGTEKIHRLYHDRGVITLALQVSPSPPTRF
jgi:methionyl-tRNA formyltransferase